MNTGTIMAMIEMVTVPVNPEAHIPAAVKLLEPVRFPIQVKAGLNPQSAMS
jgi:hypothetical protein